MPELAIRTVNEAHQIINQMQLRGIEYTPDLNAHAKAAMQAMLEQRMGDYLTDLLEQSAANEEPDRRNGYYLRHFLTEMGNLTVRVPRSRRHSAAGVIEMYRRRKKSVDQAIVACFVLGLSTRKVSEALLPMLGEALSASTVSRVASVLDTHVAAFHQRKITAKYRVLLFDGVVLKRRTGAGSQKRCVLVAMGIRPDGKKEVIDYQIASSESEQAWKKFINSLYKRGLTGEEVKLISTDGGKGLIAALDHIYPEIPLQRCWAHKVRNLTDYAKKADHDTVLRAAQKIYQAKNRTQAQSAAGRFVRRFDKKYPKMTACLKRDLEQLLNFYHFKTLKWRKATRTTNAIERCFVEVRRRTRPMGVFSDKTSMDRILFAVFTRLNKSQGITPLFLLTHNS